MKCKNIYCLHQTLNSFGTIADWNDTDCGMYEIDPYDKHDNPTGFKIDDCEAKKRFDVKTGVFMLNYEEMKPGDSFFIPNIQNTKSCKTVYRNVRKRGLEATLKKECINGVPGISIFILKRKT